MGRHCVSAFAFRCVTTRYLLTVHSTGCGYIEVKDIRPGKAVWMGKVEIPADQVLVVTHRAGKKSVARPLPKVMRRLSSLMKSESTFMMWYTMVSSKRVFNAKHNKNKSR
jgi:hypothetical protein